MKKILLKRLLLCFKDPPIRKSDSRTRRPRRIDMVEIRDSGRRRAQRFGVQEERRVTDVDRRHGHHRALHQRRRHRRRRRRR